MGDTDRNRQMSFGEQEADGGRGGGGSQKVELRGLEGLGEGIG